jgi:hypothetical protein
VPRRYTLRSILVAVPIIALLASWQTNQLRVSRQLRAANVLLDYEYQFDDWYDEDRYTRNHDNRLPLLVRLLGPDVASNIVKLRSTQSNDPSHIAVLAAELPKLRTIAIQDCSLTDADLTWFAELTNLRGLHLSGTRITNDAVATLRQLRHLRVLNITNTALSNDAIELLRESLTETRIHTGPRQTGSM